ncbi:DUF4376 domain-containing protein [Oceanisphaera sp. KMM 10153]|uniref:DUF4376 domain-containing protein n=1 Tax=Oceanisphaera submarina TaxID=3390193 RepID=UPI0039767596
MKHLYDPTTREPITGILPASVTLPFKTTPPPEPGAGQYVLASPDGSADDWELIAKEGDEWSLDFHQQAKHAEINQWRDAQEAENLQFEHGGHQWDGGTASKNRMAETLALGNALAALPAGFFWTSAADVDVPMTLTELQALADSMAAARGLRGFEIHSRQRQMKADVVALDTIEAVQSYVIGWL